MYSVCCAGTPAQIEADKQLLEVADGGGEGGVYEKRGGVSQCSITTGLAII